MLSPIRTALSSPPRHLLLYPPSVACPSNISRTSSPWVSPPEPFFVVDGGGYIQSFDQTILTFSFSSQFDHLGGSKCYSFVAHALLARFDAPITCIFRSVRSSCDRTPKGPHITAYRIDPGTPKLLSTSTCLRPSFSALEPPGEFSPQSQGLLRAV